MEIRRKVLDVVSRFAHDGLSKLRCVFLQRTVDEHEQQTTLAVATDAASIIAVKNQIRATKNCPKTDVKLLMNRSDARDVVALSKHNGLIDINEEGNEFGCHSIVVPVNTSSTVEFRAPLLSPESRYVNFQKKLNEIEDAPHSWICFDAELFGRALLRVAAIAASDGCAPDVYIGVPTSSSEDNAGTALLIRYRGSSEVISAVMPLACSEESMEFLRTPFFGANDGCDNCSCSDCSPTKSATKETSVQ